MLQPNFETQHASEHGSWNESKTAD